MLQSMSYSIGDNKHAVMFSILYWHKRKNHSKIAFWRSFVGLSVYPQKNFGIHLSCFLTLYPGEGGGAFLAQTIRLLNIALKWLDLALCNFVIFSLHLLGTFSWTLAKSIHHGGFCSCFWNEMSRLVNSWGQILNYMQWPIPVTRSLLFWHL